MRVGAVDSGIGRLEDVTAVARSAAPLDWQPTTDVIRAAVREVAPSARVDDNAQWLAPLASLTEDMGTPWFATGDGLVSALQVLAACTVADIAEPW